MNKRILCVATSQDRFSDGTRTGLWLEELTHFLREVVDNGFEYDIMSPTGGLIPVDPLSGSTNDKINQKFLQPLESDFSTKFNKPLRPDECEPEKYMAIYFAGGHGTLWDFPNNEKIQKIALSIYNNGGYICAICHGVCALLNMYEDGKPFLKGKDVTGFSNTEESILMKTNLVPFSLETELIARGANYTSNWPFLSYVVVSNRVITGQNPHSARDLGKRFVSLLNLKIVETEKKEFPLEAYRTRTTGLRYAKTLLVCTNYGDDNKGIRLEEVTDFLNTLLKEGLYRYDIASPKGGYIPIDQRRSERSIRRLSLFENLKDKLDNSMALSEVKYEDYALVYLVGGRGCMYDFPQSELLRNLIRDSIEHGVVVAAIGHGVAGLLDVKLTNGNFLVDKRELTGFTNAEETLIMANSEPPFMLESSLKQRGAIFSKAMVPFTSHVVTSITAYGTLITGQNPQSISSLVNDVLKQLRARYFGLESTASKTLKIREIHPDVWIFQRPYSYQLCDIGLNTVVIRLRKSVKEEDKNVLFVYNPSSLDDPAMTRELGGRGTVRYVMSGSVNHHAYMTEWQRNYPNAIFIPSIGLEQKIKDVFWVSSDERIEILNSLKDEILYWDINAGPEANETVLFHIKSSTLMVTDSFMHFDSSAKLSGAIIGHLTSSYDQLSVCGTWFSSIKNLELVNQGLSKVADWNFTKITLGHGQFYESVNVKKDFYQAISNCGRGLRIVELPKQHEFKREHKKQEFKLGQEQEQQIQQQYPLT